MTHDPVEARRVLEVHRRKTFAIISHPDAGKTTLTEKLLLYGGVIQLAGAVKEGTIAFRSGPRHCVQSPGAGVCAVTTIRKTVAARHAAIIDRRGCMRDSILWYGPERRMASVSVFTNPASGAAEHAAAYTRAILDLLGDRDPNDVLRETLAVLPQAIAGLSAPQLRQPELPGKWSIGQILQHLADSEVVWAWRMRVILAQDRPPITGYDQDLWADRLHYADADPAESLDAFAILRRDNLRLLERATPDDLQRVGVHSERGEESAGYLRGLYAGHDLLHLNQIARIRKSLA